MDLSIARTPAANSYLVFVFSVQQPRSAPGDAKKGTTLVSKKNQKITTLGSFFTWVEMNCVCSYDFHNIVSSRTSPSSSRGEREAREFE